MPTPNIVHQADLLFFSHDTLGGGRGQRAYKYVLTVVDVGSERRRIIENYHPSIKWFDQLHTLFVHSETDEIVKK